MAEVIYQCPATLSLRIITATSNVRVRPLEYFGVDDADAAAVAVLLAAGFDIGLYTVDEEVIAIDDGNPNHLRPHNPFGL